jgi:predicted PurR-regulated permease PerM
MASVSSTSPSDVLLRRIAILVFILVAGLLTVFGYYASSICITVILAAFLAILFDPVVIILEKLHAFLRGQSGQLSSISSTCILISCSVAPSGRFNVRGTEFLAARVSEYRNIQASKLYGIEHGFSVLCRHLLAAVFHQPRDLIPLRDLPGVVPACNENLRNAVQE